MPGKSGLRCVASFPTAIRSRPTVSRATSGTVVANMSYAKVTRLIQSGHIHVAVQSEGYRDWLRDALLGRDRVEWWEKKDGPPLMLPKQAEAW